MSNEIIKPGYDRVTKILSQWNQFAGIGKEIIENKAAIGSEVHDMIDMHEKGLFSAGGVRAESYFSAYLNWRGNQVGKPTSMEERLYSDNLMVTGKYDQVWDGVIVDFKTSSVASQWLWRLQGNFYALLALENDLDFGDTCKFVQLKENGTYKEFVFEIDPVYMAVCASAVTTFRYLKASGVIKD
jgi:hypothetical protein